MKYWAFDLDGTLVDSFPHYFEALRLIFARHGSRFDEELRYAALTEPLVQFFEQRLGEGRSKPALEILQAVSNEDATRIRAFDGLFPLIRELSESGARVAVWTNRDLVSAELILKYSGLGPYAELCVSGSCVQLRKPNPEGLLRIVDHFGCHPSELTMVGDHEHDMIGAKMAGTRAVRASWHGHFEIENCRKADVQFYQVSEFASWIKEGAPELAPRLLD